MHTVKLPIIRQDLANHATYGAALACLGAFHSTLAGAILCAGFAIGKEVYDRASRNGTPDIMDAVATMIGGAFVLVHLLGVS
jgi:hypothetical protein